MKSISEFQPELERIMKGIAKQFGSNCEVVLHDHSKGLNHSIVAIENGQVTGRKVGDASTNIGFEISRNEGKWDDQYGYITKLKNGKTIRSSSVYLKDDSGKVLGALCINFDISNFLKTDQILKEFAVPESDAPVHEIFVSNVVDILDQLIDEYLSNNALDLDHLEKSDMLGLIRHLEEHGAFLIRNAAVKVCKLLHISKFTLYAYLKEINVQTGDKSGNK